MEKSDRQEQMLGLVKHWEASGQSQKDFAREHNLNLHTFKYWVYKFRRKHDEPAGFIRLDHFATKEICLRYPNGVELLVPAQTPASTLRELVKFAG